VSLTLPCRLSDDGERLPLCAAAADRRAAHHASRGHGQLPHDGQRAVEPVDGYVFKRYLASGLGSDAVSGT